MALSETRTQALSAAIAAIHERYGTHALRPLDQQAPPPRLIAAAADFADLAPLMTALALPASGLFLLTGPPTSGMTTLALRLLASQQAGGVTALVIDLAHAFDAAYAAHCGLRLESLLLIRPTTLPEALEIAHDLLLAGQLAITLLTAPGAPASAVTGSLLRRLAGRITRSGSLFLLVQPTPPPALTQVASIRLHGERQGWRERDGTVTGYQVRVTAAKHRAASRGSTSFTVTLGAAEDGP